MRVLLFIASTLLLVATLAPNPARSSGAGKPATAKPARYTIAAGRLVAVEPSGARVPVASVGVVCDQAQLTVAGHRLVYQGRFCAGTPLDVALNHARRV